MIDHIVAPRILGELPLCGYGFRFRQFQASKDACQFCQLGQPARLLHWAVATCCVRSRCPAIQRRAGLRTV